MPFWARCVFFCVHLHFVCRMLVSCLFLRVCCVAFLCETYGTVFPCPRSMWACPRVPPGLHATCAISSNIISHKENKKTNGVGVRHSLDFPLIFLLVWELWLLRACHLTGVAYPVSTVVVGHVLLCLWVNATCTNSTNISSRIMDTTISWVFFRYPRKEIKQNLRGRDPPFENPPRSGSAVR